MGEIIILNLEEFLEEIRPSIKWSASTGFHRCTGCGRQMDSTEKLSHWPKYCRLSKDKKLKKLRDQILAENFPTEEKPTLQEVVSTFEYIHGTYGHITSLFFGTINQLSKVN